MLLCYRSTWHFPTAPYRAISLACPFLGCFCVSLLQIDTQFQLRPQKCFSCFLSWARPNTARPYRNEWRELSQTCMKRNSINLELSMKVIFTHLLRAVHTQRAAAGKWTWKSIKTLIIWENLRNCVFHVTFYYFAAIFITHQTCIDCRLAKVLLLTRRYASRQSRFVSSNII